MCWNIYKHKNINNDYNTINNFLINMLNFKKIKSISSCIKYKNRFLKLKRSSKLQFVGLFLNNGNKIKILKLINKIYLNFLHKFHELNINPNYFNIINNYNTNYGEFINLYNTFHLFKDWSKALIWQLEDILPIIKVISKKIKKKKKKKKIKKKKFNLEYKYIKKNFRFQIALKWLSLLIKTSSKKLYEGFLKIFIPFLINPNQSKYINLKKKIYTNLLLSI